MHLPVRLGPPPAGSKRAATMNKRIRTTSNSISVNACAFTLAGASFMIKTTLSLTMAQGKEDHNGEARFLVSRFLILGQCASSDALTPTLSHPMGEGTAGADVCFRRSSGK